MRRPRNSILSRNKFYIDNEYESGDEEVPEEEPSLNNNRIINLINNKSLSISDKLEKSIWRKVCRKQCMG